MKLALQSQHCSDYSASKCFRTRLQASKISRNNPDPMGGAREKRREYEGKGSV